MRYIIEIGNELKIVSLGQIADFDTVKFAGSQENCENYIKIAI